MVIASLGGSEVLLAGSGDYVLKFTVLNHEYNITHKGGLVKG
jgi:hypothetical protein